MSRAARISQEARRLTGPSVYLREIFLKGIPAISLFDLPDGHIKDMILRIIERKIQANWWERDIEIRTELIYLKKEIEELDTD